MRKILIVDDHPLIIIGLQVLAKKGVKDTEIFGVVDISSAEKVLKQHKIDLIVLDLGISDGNAQKVSVRSENIKKMFPSSYSVPGMNL